MSHEQPIILAIDTATEACSAALLLSKNQIDTKFEIAPREHTRLILPMIESLLKEASLKLADIDAIAFGQGPGAFTGLRIAAGIVQGLALSQNKPIIAVSTLAALALGACNQETQHAAIVAAIDARMNEVYWGKFSYQDQQLLSIGSEQVSAAEEILKHIDEENVLGIGSGWDTYGDALLAKQADDEKAAKIQIFKEQFPSAKNIALLALAKLQTGDMLAAEAAQPIYLRNKVAEKSKKQH